MKRVIYLGVLVFISSFMVQGQTTKAKKDPVGKWFFEAPSAPKGYTAGTIEIGYSDKKYPANVVFSGSENKFICDRVKYKNDTLHFNIFIEDENVAVKLKYEDKTKMAGKAVYSERMVPLSLIREMKKK